MTCPPRLVQGEPHPLLHMVYASMPLQTIRYCSVPLKPEANRAYIAFKTAKFGQKDFCNWSHYQPSNPLLFKGDF